MYHAIAFACPMFEELHLVVLAHFSVLAGSSRMILKEWLDQEPHLKAI
jgi:hypothetical protein